MPLSDSVVGAVNVKQSYSKLFTGVSMVLVIAISHMLPHFDVNAKGQGQVITNLT